MKVNASCHVNLRSSIETPSFFFVVDIRGFPPAETIGKHTEHQLTCQTVEISLCGQVSRLCRLQAAFLLPLTQRVLHPSVYPTQPNHFRFIYCKLCLVTNFTSRQLIFYSLSLLASPLLNGLSNELTEARIYKRKANLA